MSQFMGGRSSRVKNSDNKTSGYSHGNHRGGHSAEHRKDEKISGFGQKVERKIREKDPKSAQRAQDTDRRDEEETTQILSNSHINDVWRGYAAATVASNAKELLSIIPEHPVAHTQTAISEIEIEPRNDSASMRIHRAFTLLRRKTSNKKQDLTNVAEAQQILLQELNLSAQAGPPSSRDRLRILHYLTVTERKISISRGLEIKHLDQAEKYVNKALNLTPLSGMAGAQEQLAIERFIINGLRAILGFQKGTENAESKQTLLRNTIAGMSQAWENLEKVDKVIFEKNRNFVRKWIHEFMAA